MGPKLDGEKPPVIYIDSLVLQQISGPILFKQIRIFHSSCHTKHSKHASVSIKNRSASR